MMSMLSLVRSDTKRRIIPSSVSVSGSGGESTVCVQNVNNGQMTGNAFSEIVITDEIREERYFSKQVESFIEKQQCNLE